MRLSQLSLYDFRNIEKAAFTFERDLVIFCAPNGTGKTNILESIFLLSNGKSWREKSSSDLIRWEALSPHALIKGVTDASTELEIRIAPKNRQFFLNGKKASRLSFMGHLPTILFCPEWLSLVQESRSKRLMFFDRFLSQLSEVYREHLLKALRAHKQKNALLKQELPQKKLLSLLAPWNAVLLEVLPALHEARAQFLAQINPLLHEAYQYISQKPQEHLSLKLENKYGIPITSAALEAFYHTHQAQELQRRQNVLSPYLEDFVFYLHRTPASQSASRGELRSLFLSLLYAQKHYTFQQKGEMPLLLLDDVFSELDDARQNHLWRICEGCQSFVTTTHESYFRLFPSSQRQVYFLSSADFSST